MKLTCSLEMKLWFEKKSRYFFLRGKFEKYVTKKKIFHEMMLMSRLEIVSMIKDLEFIASGVRNETRNFHFNKLNLIFPLLSSFAKVKLINDTMQRSESIERKRWHGRRKVYFLFRSFSLTFLSCSKKYKHQNGDEKLLCGFQ